MENFTTVIGMDLGDRRSQLCVLDHGSGEAIEETQVATRAATLQRYFGRHPSSLVVIEVGTHSGWVSRLLDAMGHTVLVADARKVRRLMGSDRKDDALDAEFLARIGRVEPKLLKPIQHRSADTQAALAVIRSRVKMVETRTALINHVRGVVKAAGQRLPKCTTERFHKLEGQLPVELHDALLPVMRCIGEMTASIKRYDRLIAKKAETEYPETAVLQQVHGVGPLTALTYRLIIEDPRRFARNRDVGAYVGLCGRLWQSGESDPQKGISKQGDQLLRRLLVQCAHHILGPFGADSDLRRWGLAYMERGGKNAKKRACVAVARKLAVLLLSLWKSGAAYEPLRLAATVDLVNP